MERDVVGHCESWCNLAAIAGTDCPLCLQLTASLARLLCARCLATIDEGDRDSATPDSQGVICESSVERRDKNLFWMPTASEYQRIELIGQSAAATTGQSLIPLLADCW
jgi:hypothetical protein